MSLVSQLQTLATRVATEFKTLRQEMAGGLPPGYVVLNLATHQTIADSTLAVIAWTSERSDVQGWHATNSSDVIIPPGSYMITVNYSWGTSTGTDLVTTGSRFIHLEVDEVGDVTRIIAAQSIDPSSAYGDATGVMSIAYSTLVQSTLRVKVYQTSGAARAFGGANRLPSADGISANTEFSVVTMHGPVPTPLVFSFGGVNGLLAVGSGIARMYAWRPLTITKVTISAGSAPTGSSVIVDVNKNGTTIFTTQANRPAIAASAFISTGMVPNIVSMVAGDYLTIDIDQVGSTLPGNYGQVTIEYK